MDDVGTLCASSFSQCRQETRCHSLLEGNKYCQVRCTIWGKQQWVHLPPSPAGSTPQHYQELLLLAQLKDKCIALTEIIMEGAVAITFFWALF